jgi:hypothetical protein
VLSLVTSLRQIEMLEEAMQRRGVGRAKGMRTTEVSGGGVSRHRARSALDGERDAHATADAKAGQTLARIAPDHFV